MNSYIDASNWTNFLTVFDYLLTPFYLVIVYYFARRICDKHYPRNHPWRRYFMTGFTLKIVGAIFIGLVYNFYYGGGDTSAYWYHGKVINSALGDSFWKWLNLMMRIPDGYDINYFEYTDQMMWYGDRSAYMTSALTAFFNLFTFNTFLPTSILFAAVSFTGNWAMFKTFATQYPKLTRPIAICVLFIPSTFVWGSGIFKDTICIAALGWLTYACFKMLINREFSLKYLLTIAFCFYILAIIKVYIIIVFIPALALWILNTYSQKVRNGVVRTGLKLIVYTALIAGFSVAMTTFSTQLGKYSLEKISETSNTTREYISYVSKYRTGEGEEGSSYDLGEFDPGLGSMLAKFPLAVNVALFRPYLWEARNPMVFANSIEAFLFLFFTLRLLFTVSLARIWRSISKNPNVQFFLMFSLTFAFSVGISSYNFGTLSRYRIPCLPFYLLALVLIYYENNPGKKSFFYPLLK